MSKSSTASATKNPTPLSAKSAWARGPPQTATAPSPRSQSPAPSTPVHQTHSRRPSALGQGVPVKDGVSVPRSNVGSVKQGAAVTFGSIDDASASISSSPAAAPPVKSEGSVKSFGSVPNTTGHVNGKASISSRASVVPPPASISSASSSAAPSPAPSNSSSSAPPKPKIDIKKMFQSTPSTSTPTDSPSPSTRTTGLPPQQPSSISTPSSQHPPSQLGAHSYTPFVPSGHVRPNGPNGGPPRSPSYRQVPNGTAPRSQVPNGGPSAGLSSPRLTPHQQHNGQPSGLPPTTPQMQPPHMTQMHPHMQWGSYYYAPQESSYPPMFWYGAPMPMQPHQPPPPGQHIQPHTGMPMSPRNPPTALQNPGTPTMPHAVATPVHPPHPPPTLSHPQTSIGGITSPPPTPSAAPSNRLNPGTSAFVPRKVTLKNQDGVELNIGDLKPGSGPAPPAAGATPSTPSVYRQGSPGTPNRRPASVRIESEDQRKARLAQEQAKESKEKADAEEKAKKEKEETDRKQKLEDEKRRKQDEAEKERLRKIEEEKEKDRKEKDDKEKAEAERVRKEKEEKEAAEREAKRLQEEEERKKQEEETRKADAAKELERLRAEKEAKEKEEKEKAAEQERIAKEQEAEKLRLEQEAAKQAEVAAKEKEEGEIVEQPESTETLSREEQKEKAKEALRINTVVSPGLDRKQRPGPLDLTDAKKSGVSTPGALATARIISDISSIQYPEGVRSPHPGLNENAKEGKFRYDRDFLMQFMSICKEKPAMLPSLDAIGLEPVDPASLHLTRGGSGRHRQGSGAGPPSRQASIGLGVYPNTLGKNAGSSFNPMGNFTVGGSKLGNSDERFAASTRAASVGGAAGMQFNRPIGLTRTASQGGPVPRERTRSKRGEKRSDKNAAQQSQFGAQHQQDANLEPVAPLQQTANRWDRKAKAEEESPEFVDRKVKALLNKLTMEKFDSISDQIIAWANKSEKEKDGRTLIQVIRLVFEKATDEATWSEMYARLCRKMMEQISPAVQDDGIKNNEGKPIAGGQLFRKYLLNRCQEDFERGWVQKETTAAAAASKAKEDDALKASNDKKGDEEIALYSDEYYAAQKAKRQGLGLIKFIGELFKLQMLTERIMHECVKKLLGNVDNPEEEEIESLCKLLTTVGSILDTPKARAHLDVYFTRMKELTKSPNVNSRMQFMLQDLLELRDRKWVSRTAVAAPATIAQIHEAAAKEKAAAEKESFQRQMSMSRGGSRRGGDRGDVAQVGPDGWTTAGSSAPRPPPKAGDLSNFGKISKGQPMTFGPSSVFAGKKGAEGKRESITRTSSSSNMFSMLSSQSAESSEKPAEPQRKRLILQPRSKPVESTETAETSSPVQDNDSSSEDDTPAAAPEMSEADAKRKIDEDAKEFWGIRDLTEAEAYFTSLPAKHHHILITKLVSFAVESKQPDAELVGKLFERATSKELVTSEEWVEGLGSVAEIIEDIAIDAPKAKPLFAIMVKGAGLPENVLSQIAARSEDSSLLSLLTA